MVGYLGGYFSRTYAIQEEKQIALNYYLNAHTLHSEHFEAQTLSEKHWNDEFFGNIMPNTIQGSPRGVYAPVKIETDDHSYEGQVILAPRGIDKTSNWGTQINVITLDYAQQTRSYLDYSDFEDPLVMYTTATRWVHDDSEGGMIEEKYTVLRDSGMLYMRNTIMFLEEAVHDATTSNNDVHYDRVIPYMMSVDPMFIFADSEGTIPLPEFYEEYPIYVAPDKYDDLKEEYHSIYKIYDGSGSSTIQLFPTSSPHAFASEVVSFEAHLVDTLGNEMPLGNFVDNHEYNNLTGEVTLTSDNEINTFTSSINSWEENNKNIANYDACIILHFKIEKFRDITDTGDLTTDDVNRIATMQSVQASVLEYIYQFSIAQSTQERLNEIAYTAFLTSITTVISLVVSYGYSAIVSKISSSMMSPWISAEKGVSDIFYQNLAKDLFGLTSTASKTASTLGNIFKVVKSVVAVGSEVVEELLVDPWIEAYVSNMVAKAGGDVYEQIWWSTLAESGRESGFNLATTTIQQLVAPSQTQVSGNLHSTSQDTMFDLHQMQADLRTQQESMTGEIIETAASSILLLLGAVGGGMFGSAGASIGNIMIGFGTSVEGIDSVKDMFEAVLKREPIQKADILGPQLISSVQAYVAANNWIQQDISEAIEWAQLDQPQKPIATQEMVKDIKRMIPYGFYGYADSGLGAFFYFSDLGYDTTEIGVYMGGMAPNPNDRKMWIEDDELIRRSKNNIEDLQYTCYQMVYYVYDYLSKEAKRDWFPLKEFEEDLEYIKNRVELAAQGHDDKIWMGNLYSSKEAINIQHKKLVIPHKVFERFINKFVNAYYEAFGFYKSESINYFREYLRFSKFLTYQRYYTPPDSSSNLVSSKRLYDRSSLIENILEIFPRFNGIRFSYSRLSELMSKSKKSAYLSHTFLIGSKIERKVPLYMLFNFDYNIQKLTRVDFRKIGLEISTTRLDQLKQDFSQLIKEFITSNPYDEPYITGYDSSNPDPYIESKYELLRNLYFLVEESNKGTTPTSFKDMAKAIGILAYQNIFTPKQLLVRDNIFGGITVNRIRAFIKKQAKSIVRVRAYTYLARHSRILRQNLDGLVGTKTHRAIELYFMQSLKLKSIIEGIFHEKKVGSFGTRVDLFITRTSKFINLIERPSGIDLSRDTGEDIKYVVFDFTHTLERDLIEKKFWKEYQDQNTVFYTILTNPEATSGDTDYDSYLNAMPDDRYPDHIKVVLLDDIISLFKVEKEIREKIEELYEIVEDCLQYRNLKKQEKALERLEELYEKAGLYLKFPLSQQRLDDLLGI